MWSKRDLEIRRQTFDNLKELKIGVPLGSLSLNLPPVLSVEEQEKIRQRQENNRNSIEKLNIRAKKSGKTAGNNAGLGQREAAFARALEARGFDTRNTARICRGWYTVMFKANEWSLSKGDEILHTQPFGAGSISVVDRVVSRHGGY